MKKEIQKTYDKMVGKEAKASANDLDVIYDLQAATKKLKKELKGSEKRHTDVKRRLYNDFQKENKKQVKVNNGKALSWCIGGHTCTWM